MTKPSTPPAWVSALLDHDLSAIERVVLAYFAWRQGRNGEAWPSQRTIAADLGLTEEGVRKIVRRLTEMGRLSVTYPESSGRGHRLHYSITSTRTPNGGSGIQEHKPPTAVGPSNQNPQQETPNSRTKKPPTAVPSHKMKNTTRTHTRGERAHVAHRKQCRRKFTPPTPRQVEEYAWELGYTNFHQAEAFCAYYAPRRWRDTNGRPVKDWRAKLRAVWLKDLRKPQRGDFDWLPTLEELEKIDGECSAYDARLGLEVTT